MYEGKNTQQLQWDPGRAFLSYSRHS